jgi:hypothetical protein
MAVRAQQAEVLRTVLCTVAVNVVDVQRNPPGDRVDFGPAAFLAALPPK